MIGVFQKSMLGMEPCSDVFISVPFEEAGRCSEN